MNRRVSESPATRVLKKAGVAYSEHPYSYVDHGGAGEAARQLALPATAVVKTLIMQDERARPLVVLMHGDCDVSTKNLARQAGFKSVQACQPDVAQRHSGYQVGGTSPFGLRKAMPVFAQASIMDLERIYINGGRRGYLLGMAPAVLRDLVDVRLVDCALPQSART